ncbi:hypothetical protein Goshw_013167 [Gossypium schwendimanii]|uniref:RNase H type-1 domain-containing protein n=1 Tax=Gossypium schwendimanii TaxID=34291 RepID=A0A7J9KS51_GOSSC|nr:hypothetical protein [Gossypium schwendimanii]
MGLCFVIRMGCSLGLSRQLMAACHAAIVKVLGIREALSWLKTCCFNNIVVEFDCIEVITALQSNTLLSPKVCLITGLCPLSNTFTFTGSVGVLIELLTD